MAAGRDENRAVARHRYGMSVGQVARPRRGSTVRRVRLGQTDLQVSMIAFGTWSFGGNWGAADLQDSRNCIHEALELGINFFDTEVHWPDPHTAPEETAAALEELVGEGKI